MSTYLSLFLRTVIGLTKSVCLWMWFVHVCSVTTLFNWLVHDACHQEASGSAAPAPKRPKEAIYGKLLYRAAGYCRIVFFEDFISFREYRDIKIDKTYFA